jgi:hypothetical protein
MNFSTQLSCTNLKQCGGSEIFRDGKSRAVSTVHFKERVIMIMIMIITTIIIIIPFMQGIHTYIPETNHVSRVHSVAVIPRVLFMVHIPLSSILNSFVLLH